MATLSLQDQQRIERGLMRVAPNVFGSIPSGVKDDLLAAVQAADTWADSNSASYNSALPTTFRTNATQAQKALLLAAVIAARFGVGALITLLGVQVD